MQIHYNVVPAAPVITSDECERQLAPPGGRGGGGHGGGRGDQSPGGGQDQVPVQRWDGHGEQPGGGEGAEPGGEVQQDLDHSHSDSHAGGSPGALQRSRPNPHGSVLT